MTFFMFRCDPQQAFSKVPYPVGADFGAAEAFGTNAGVIAGVVCTATGLILIALVMLICRYVYFFIVR